MKRYAVAQLDELAPVPCPCGQARRAFADPTRFLASTHLVEIRTEAQSHHHQHGTEIYVVLEGEGFLELDGERVPVRPLTAVYIRPGCRHRAIGNLRLINIPIPVFDPRDEVVEEASSPGT